MEIVIDGLGRRGYRHTVASIDLSKMHGSEVYGDQYLSEQFSPPPYSRRIFSEVNRNDDQSVSSITIKSFTDIRTNGNYRLIITLTAKDILFLSWVILRDRSFEWISSEFSRVRKFVAGEKSRDAA